jgi:hypothetical protein
MVCFTKPVLTEDFGIGKEEEFSITRYMCEIYTGRKAKRIHKRQTHLLVGEKLHKDCDRENSDEKNLCS